MLTEAEIETLERVAQRDDLESQTYAQRILEELDDA